MSRLLEHVARLFLAPEAAPVEEGRSQWRPPGAPETRVEKAHPVRVGVVCSPRDAGVAGGALALAVAHTAGASTVTVIEWTGKAVHGGRDRASAPGVRRAAAMLRDQGHAARASGRIVRVLVAAEEEAATIEAMAAMRGADGPTVLVVAGPRTGGMEALLAGRELVVLAARRGADPELTGLAAEELGRLAPVTCIELGSSPAAAALARSGTALVAPLRSPFLAGLGSR